MKVFILKEGKEYNQGVAYLDDGTMVVVDNARKLIGRTIDVVVTSVLQTTAGKMIFGRFVDPSLASTQGMPERDEPRERRTRVAPPPQAQGPTGLPLREASRDQAPAAPSQPSGPAAAPDADAASRAANGGRTPQV
jgi:hypothetical protein